VVGSPSLEELDLSFNLLGGGLPDLPANVSRVGLEGNPGLAGTLPAQWSGATKMGSLWLTASLTGAVPAQWAAWGQLRELVIESPGTGLTCEW